MWRVVRQFLADERATSDVEYVLITGLIVIPMFIVIPPLLVAANVTLFDRIHLWVHLPFP